tara:strand:+ start:780 stop:1013 length:234 start_codon:yes stop_codon:yes gene_type:complete
MPAKQKRIPILLVVFVTLFGFSIFCSLNLKPIAVDQWSENHAAHFSSRAVFGLLPKEIALPATKEAKAVVAYFVGGD